MNDAVTKALDLVSYLEPGRAHSTLQVVVGNCAEDPAHFALLGELEAIEAAKNGIYHEKRNLVDLDPARLCGGDHRFTFGELTIFDTLTDRDLANAGYHLAELRKVNPAENDADSILENINSADDLAKLAFEYISYEDDLFQNMVGTPVAEPRFNERLVTEVERINSELLALRMGTVSSPKAFDLLAQAAKSEYGIERDETLVHVTVKSINDRWNTTNDNDEWATAIWVALHGNESLWGSHLVVMPAWAVALLRACAPNIPISSPYPVGTLSASVLETAQTLWERGESTAYADFDEAVRAATQLCAG